jgi:hypothetical protein
MAQRIRQRRRRGVDGERGPRPGPREDRGCALSRLCWKLPSPTEPIGRSHASSLRSRGARARGSAKRGADLRAPARGQVKKVAMIGSLNHVTRQVIVHTSATKRSSDFIAHLEQLDPSLPRV